MRAVADRVPQLLTVTETMGVLKVSRATIYRLFAAGELSWVQIGAHRRVTVAEVERFVSSHCEVAS